MTLMLQTFWAGADRPLSATPAAVQVAALCFRDGPQETQVLLITSSSGRWILPKGWPIDGLTEAEAAAQEAWEEAGVQSTRVADAAFGSYLAEKRYTNGAVVPCEVRVFPMQVKALADSFPESDRRERRWASIPQAASMVAEEGLALLLESFGATHTGKP